jgi:hypothetical protein
MQLKASEMWTEGTSTLPDSLELVHDGFSESEDVGGYSSNTLNF